MKYKEKTFQVNERSFVMLYDFSQKDLLISNYIPYINFICTFIQVSCSLMRYALYYVFFLSYNQAVAV
ncbi:hypothetical protein IIM_03906 [Bacillus cereus VD107]|nr:hypothetical protein IIM_03906 [Bacillus cereus VD107]